MTSSTSDPIVSGVSYQVTQVEGRTPSTIEDFAGPVTMHTHGPTGDHEIAGAGEDPHGGVVRVHEKDHEGTGNDVRVWTVSPARDRNGFDATG